MERYFFHFVSDQRHFPAHDGLDLPDLDAAIAHAKFAIGTVFKSNMDTYDWSGWRVSIRDAADQELFVVPIAETLLSLGAHRLHRSRE